MASSTLSTPSASDSHPKQSPLPQQSTPVQQQSPRNTSLGSSSTTSTTLQFGIVEVPKQMQDGEKFIKWDEVSLNFFLFSFIFSEGFSLSFAYV